MVDITQGKRAEEEIKNSEELFKIIFEYAPDAYYLSDLKGKFIDVNRVAEAVIGFKKQEIIGKSLLGLDLLPVDQIPKAVSLLAKNAQGRPTGPDELVLKRKVGDKVSLEIRTYPIKVQGKTVVLGIARDITERKIAEELLRESEEKFRNLAEQSPSMIFIYKKRRVIYANKKFEEILGFSKEEIYAPEFDFLKLSAPEYREKTISSFEKFIGGEEAAPFEHTLLSKEGKKLEAILATRLIDYGGGRAILGIVTDITERKHMENALKESEKRFRSVVEHSHEGILVLDDAFRIIYINGEGTRISGYSPEEIVGRDFRQFVDDPSKGQVAEYYILRQRGEPVPSRYEFNIVRKGGELRCVEISSSVIEDSKGRVETTAQMLDITERKRAKEQLEESFKSLRKAMNGIIQAIALTVERRDPYTAGHQRRVADLARAIATTLALPKEQIEGIRIAAVIHDIGKIAVPAEILSRPGSLNSHEFSLIKDHAKIGYEILKEIEFPWPIAQIVFQHHERLDGSGYPQGLAGQNILLEARILAVADVVEAMASHRPYRPAHGEEKALEEISTNRATRYDPDAVDACLNLFREKEFKFR